MDKITVLYVSANPTGTATLAVNEEVNKIYERIFSGFITDQINFHHIPEAGTQDLLDRLNRYKPHILHFSTHGYENGDLILSQKDGGRTPITASAMQAITTAVKDNIRLIIFDVCDSEPQAKAVTQTIDCAIGMCGKITDKAAILFSSSFYMAIAFGRSIYEAFEQARAAILAEYPEEHEFPVLYTKAGVNPRNIAFFKPEHTDPNTIQFDICENDHAFLAKIDLSKVKRLTLLSHTGRQLYSTVHRTLDNLILQNLKVPEEIRVLTRTPSAEGYSRNTYIRGTIAKLNAIRLKHKNVSVRFYESVPAYRAIICEYPDQSRTSYISSYNWPEPNRSKSYDLGFLISDTLTTPNPVMSIVNTWIEQFWGRNEIHTIVFDFDNTLVFTGDIQINAWIKAIEESLSPITGLLTPDQLSPALGYIDNIPVSANRVMCDAIKKIFIDQQLAGNIVKSLFVGVTSNQLKEINQIRFKTRQNLMDDARAFEGLESMLNRLKVDHNFAIISSTKAEMIDEYLMEKELKSYFPLVLGQTESTLKQEQEYVHHKEMLLVKLSQIIGIPISRMLLIGDSQTDSLAANQVNMPFIEARVAAAKMKVNSFIPKNHRGRYYLGSFDSYQDNTLPELLRRHAATLTRDKYMDHS